MVTFSLTGDGADCYLAGIIISDSWAFGFGKDNVERQRTYYLLIEGDHLEIAITYRYALIMHVFLVQTQNATCGKAISKA